MKRFSPLWLFIEGDLCKDCVWFLKKISMSVWSNLPSIFTSIPHSSFHPFIFLVHTFCCVFSFISLFTLNSHMPFFLTVLHTSFSLFLVIPSSANVPSPHQHAHSYTYTHTHLYSHNHRTFSSTSSSEGDWLITTQKAWLCWCQKQDRYPRPQGAWGRWMSLSSSTPFSFPSPFSSFTLPHTHWTPLITKTCIIFFFSFPSCKFNSQV